MRLLRPYNPLTYPAGRLSGFDPTHVLAGVKTRFSFVATSSGGAVDLVNGAKPGIVVGGPSALIDGALGPAIKFAASTDAFTWSSRPATTETIYTVAAIVRPSTVSGTAFYACNSSGSGTGIGPGLFTSGVTAFALTLGGDTSVTTGIVPTVGLPYFFAISFHQGTTTWNAAVRNLATGQIQTATGTQASVASPSNGTYVFGNRDTLVGIGNNSAAMFSVGRFNLLPELIQAASDPWSFWYPPISQQSFFSGVTSSGISPDTLFGAQPMIMM
jgi:hypothetical protein